MSTYVLQQLGYNILLLVIYLVGMILAAVFIRKYPVPAMLTLAGCLILLLNFIVVTMMQGYFIRARVESGWSVAEYSQMTMIVSVVGAMFRTLGTALLLAAVFIGRRVKATI